MPITTPITMYANRVILSLTLMLSLSIVGCQSLPDTPHLPKSKALTERVNALYDSSNDLGENDMSTDLSDIEAQEAIGLADTVTTDRVESAEISNVNTQTGDTPNDPNHTDLVAAISEQNQIHPDLSGYHPIVTGANAFAARSVLTDMATRNIDAQYYIWHDDQSGQLLLKDLWEAAERGVIVRLLIDDFNSSIDIHAKTASDVYGIPLDEVTKDQRRDAKVINFGVLYGMSPHGLAAATGMSFTEAKQFIDQYFAVRAPIRQYIDATLQQARSEGYVETYYGRRRPTPDIHSSNFMVRQSAERAAANMPIQGTEADLMKRAMLAVEVRLTGKANQLLQIHDSILVECALNDADDVAEILKTTMEGIAPELDISLNVDVSVGKNWGEL